MEAERSAASPLREREIRANERGLVVDAFKTFGAECAVVAKVEAFFEATEMPDAAHRSVTLEVKYEAGHSYRETWEEADLYCPSCGKQTVWIDSIHSDYYEGSGHLCVTCGSDFTMPRLGVGNSWQDKQRKKAILDAD